MADVKRYLDGIESQHKGRPKFMASTERLLTKVDNGTGLIRDMPLMFYVKKAVGAQLDIVGAKVGADRRFPPISAPGYAELLDDETYRKIILSRIVQNQWDGTNEMFREIWDSTIGDMLNAKYYDNQDMTIDMRIIGQIEPVMLEMILRGYIIPKPMGVGMSVTVTEEAQTDTDREYPESVSALVTYNSARIKVGYPKDDQQARPQIEQATLFPANSAKITMRYPTEDQEAQTQPGQATLFTANIARISIRAL